MRNKRTASSLLEQKRPVLTPNVGIPSRALASPSELKHNFSGKEDPNNFLHMLESVVMRNKSDEEKADSLVAYLDGEAFEYYFSNFMEDNAPNQEA